MADARTSDSDRDMRACASPLELYLRCYRPAYVACVRGLCGGSVGREKVLLDNFAVAKDARPAVPDRRGAELSLLRGLHGHRRRPIGRLAYAGRRVRRFLLALQQVHPALQDLAIVPHEDGGVQDSVRHSEHHAETHK